MDQQLQREMKELSREIEQLRAQLDRVTSDPAFGFRSPVSVQGQSLSSSITGNKVVVGGIDVLGTYGVGTMAWEQQSPPVSESVFFSLISLIATGRGHGMVAQVTPSLGSPNDVVGLTSTWFGPTALDSLDLVLRVNDIPNLASFTGLQIHHKATVKRVGIAGVPVAVSGTGMIACYGDTIRAVDANRTPASSAAAGNNGELCYDNDFIYVRTGGSWRRVAVATF